MPIQKAKRETLVMKSIKTKILLSSISIILFSLSVTGGIASYLSYKGTLFSLEQTMKQTVTLAAKAVSNELDGYKKVVSELAESTVFTDETISKKDKIESFRNIEKRLGFTSVELINESGFSLETGLYVKDDDYFMYCQNNLKPYITEPFIRDDTNTMNVYIAAPILNNNTFKGIVLIGMPADFLSKIVANIHIGDSGNAAILDKDGNTIGYEDMQLVIDKYNTQEEAKSDSALEKLAAIESEMTKLNSGFEEYYDGGTNKFMAYTPIDGTNGWSIDVSVSKNEFMDFTYKGIYVTLTVILVTIIISTLIMIKVTYSIVNPIKACVNRIAELSKGDLTSPIPVVTTKDETGKLAEITEVVVTSLSSIVQDLSFVLNQISEGNLNMTSTNQYTGDFIPINVAITKILSSLNDAMYQINISSDQVNSGADQVASGAQSLSQGATEQASSIEELSASISEISEQVKQTADNVQKANEFSSISEQKLSLGNQEMEQMVLAMENISNASKQIDKIIKTIDDIAFQTNILALNAAVEAARAGKAGKGFAVVANEVRNLASKSAGAAKDTTALIENAIHAVNNGLEIANRTAKTMREVMVVSKESTQIVIRIAQASSEQADSIYQITKGIEQISSVVQTNSATAEESAAASEELSGQSHILKELVNRFKLKDSINNKQQVHRNDSNFNSNSQQFEQIEGDKY